MLAAGVPSFCGWSLLGKSVVGVRAERKSRSSGGRGAHPSKVAKVGQPVSWWIEIETGHQGLKPDFSFVALTRV
jgi:hypothetical protein